MCHFCENPVCPDPVSRPGGGGGRRRAHEGGGAARAVGEDHEAVLTNENRNRPTPTRAQDSQLRNTQDELNSIGDASLLNFRSWGSGGSYSHHR